MRPAVPLHSSKESFPVLVYVCDCAWVVQKEQRVWESFLYSYVLRSPVQTAYFVPHYQSWKSYGLDEDSSFRAGLVSLVTAAKVPQSGSKGGYASPAEWPEIIWAGAGWPQSRRKNSLSFPVFSIAVNLLFHRLSQQKLNVIMTFIKSHSISTPTV